MYDTQALKLTHVRKSGRNLETLFSLKPLDVAQQTGTQGQADDGVAITSYGKGQLSGVLYTVPAHGLINVDIQFKMQCVTPQDVVTLNNLIRGMLDASQYEHFDELSKTDISGGLSFFGFFSGGVSASYEDTKHTMSGFGLSEANQVTIINAMAAMAQNVNLIHMTGQVQNQAYPYSVSGNLFAIVMDATMQLSNGSSQTRTFVAPNGIVVAPSGETLPVVPIQQP
jgi:hypothetical protein